LGRDTSSNEKKATHPGLVEGFDDNNLKAANVFVSNSSQKDSGHSAIIDKNGRLWMSGCDRWQQLGLGSANGGSGGYTWKGGKLWQDKFILSESVAIEVSKNQKTSSNSDSIDNSNSDQDNLLHVTTTAKGPNIRDVSLGGDHTLVLSSNKQEVFAFGKCGDGQCGFIGKPYVSAPKLSKLLSSNSSGNSRVSSSDNDDDNSSSRNYIAAVCAIESCSITIGDDGKILRKVGKCNPPPKSALASSSSVSSSSVLFDGIEKCIKNARRRGLINS
jgi:alpha-tubulin suppressor-like RCC1 family protein